MAKKLGLSEAQVEGAMSTLDAARRMEDDDLMGCLTLASAARKVLTHGVLRSDRTPIVSLASWNAAPLAASTWRAEALMGEDVYGRSGEEVGEVEDILMTEDGAISAIVVEGGGVLDIGDRHVRVAWDDVSLRQGDDEGVSVPLKDANMSDYSFFDEADGVQVERDEVRVSHVLGAGVRDKRGVPYGYVDDILFSEGEAKATLIRPDVAYGMDRGARPYATPYVGARHGYGVGYDFYLMPYDKAELDRLDAFDADSVGGPSETSEPAMGS
ncbi:MAG: PRC-barrel domain-containing protein [Alphaproteobacteria bacterium]